MMFRIAGIVAGFALVGYLLYSVLSSGNKVEQSINANPAVKEQQEALKNMGVDGADKDALKTYSMQQAKQIEDYQNQAASPDETQPSPSKAPQ